MRILKSAPCETEFLGERDYLQSATIIASLLHACQSDFGMAKVQALSAQFHALTDRQCRFDWLDVPSATALTQAGYVATFKIESAGSAAVVGLYPETERIACRKPYDEDALVKGYLFDADQQSVLLPTLSGALLPTVVALNKRLHAKLFDNVGFGKWLLTRLDLAPAWFFDPPHRALTLQLVAVLASVNSKVAILCEGRSLGAVHFSRKKETA